MCQIKVKFIRSPAFSHPEVAKIKANRADVARTHRSPKTYYFLAPTWCHAHAKHEPHEWNNIFEMVRWRVIVRTSTTSIIFGIFWKWMEWMWIARWRWNRKIKRIYHCMARAMSMNINATIPNLVCVRVRRSLVTVHTLSWWFNYGHCHKSHTHYAYILHFSHRTSLNLRDIQAEDRYDSSVYFFLPSTDIIAHGSISTSNALVLLHSYTLLNFSTPQLHILHALIQTNPR